MGWWKVESSNDLVGDEVFSLLRSATLAVAAAYEEEWGRPPTRTEWERLVSDALQPAESLEASSTRTIIADSDSPPTGVNIVVQR